MNADSRDVRLKRARDYPYSAPGHDFLFREGHAEAAPRELALFDRVPVLAVGSNRAPEQLARKFAGRTDDPIPVTWGWLEGFDSVHAAHVSRYGAIPSTLHPSPGTSTRLAVTWLTPDQLVRMHETEAVGVNYDFGYLREVRMTFDRGGEIGRVGAYIARRGSLAPEGRPVALDQMAARARGFATLGQMGILSWIHGRFSKGANLDDWQLELIESAEARQSLIAKLQDFATPFDDPRYSPEQPPSRDE